MCILKEWWCASLQLMLFCENKLLPQTQFVSSTKFVALACMEYIWNSHATHIRMYILGHIYVVAMHVCYMKCLKCDMTCRSINRTLLHNHEEAS